MRGSGLAMQNETSLTRYVPPGQPVMPTFYFDPFEQDQGGFSLDLSELRAMLFRQRYWILGSIAVALLLGLAITMLMTPVYRSTSTVQIEPTASILEEGQEASGQQVTSQNLNQTVQAQIEVLKSRNLAKRIVNERQLGKSRRFLNAMNIYGDAEQDADKLGAAAVGALMSHLVVNPPVNSQVVKISFDSTDPTISALIANAYADNLIKANLERHYQAGSYARQFLASQLEEVKKRLEASERAALDYARSAQVIETGSARAGGEDGAAPSGPSTTSLSAASLVQMNADLAAARTARIQAEQRWRSIAGAPLMSVPEVIDNGTIQGLQADRARLNSQLAKLRETFEDTYPDITRLKGEIAGIDQEIQAIANQIRSSIRERYQVAARQEAAMAGRMGGLKASTLDEQSLRIRYDILNREASANRQLYDGLLQRYREVSTASGAVNSSVSILDEAVPSGVPIKPRVMVNIILALLAGLGLGLLIGFVRERVNDTIRSPDDILLKLKLPLLGTTPFAKRNVLEELASSRSGVSEAYHSVRSSIEFSGERPPRSLLITSARAGEGKSTTALALAKKFAALGNRVLLVDADLRIPSLHNALGVRNDSGLVNVLTGRMKIKDAVQQIDDLDFLPSGPIPPNPTEIMSRHAISKFLADAVGEYNMVVLDGPPIMGLADAPQAASVVEATVLVVEAGRAHHGHAKTALRRLRDSNANLIGVVLTKFSARRTGSDDYGYYYEYGPDRGRRQWRVLGHRSD